jgi:toxin ParE1/3/4
MPKATVSLAESAVRDLDELRAWFAGQAAAEVGDRLVAEVLGRFVQLSDFPESGRVVPEFGQPWLGEMIRPPLRIVYRLDGTRVQVVRVWRSERQLLGFEAAVAIQRDSAARGEAQLSGEEVEAEIHDSRRARQP